MTEEEFTFDRVTNARDPFILFSIQSGSKSAGGSDHRILFHVVLSAFFRQYRRIDVLISPEGMVRFVPGLRGFNLELSGNSDKCFRLDFTTRKLRKVRGLTYITKDDATVDRNGITFKWPAEL